MWRDEHQHSPQPTRQIHNSFHTALPTKLYVQRSATISSRACEFTRMRLSLRSSVRDLRNPEHVAGILLVGLRTQGGGSCADASTSQFPGAAARASVASSLQRPHCSPHANPGNGRSGHGAPQPLKYPTIAVRRDVTQSELEQSRPSICEDYAANEVCGMAGRSYVQTKLCGQE